MRWIDTRRGGDLSQAAKDFRSATQARKDLARRLIQASQAPSLSRGQPFALPRLYPTIQGHAPSGRPQSSGFGAAPASAPSGGGFSAAFGKMMNPGAQPPPQTGGPFHQNPQTFQQTPASSFGFGAQPQGFAQPQQGFGQPQQDRGFGAVAPGPFGQPAPSQPNNGQASQNPFHQQQQQHGGGLISAPQAPPPAQSNPSSGPLQASQQSFAAQPLVTGATFGVQPQGPAGAIQGPNTGAPETPVMGAPDSSADDAAWRAPTFTLGKIPETSPPAVYCQ